MDSNKTYEESLEEDNTANQDEEKTADIEKVTETIVGISKLKQTGSSVFVNRAEEKLGLGSGVVITDNGYILTNQHVSGSKYSSCYVTTKAGKKYNANVLWADSDLDLAIIKIDETGLTAAEFGDSDSLKLGEFTMAIGNALGMGTTITCGVISAVNREVSDSTENRKYKCKKLSKFSLKCSKNIIHGTTACSSIA